MWAGPLVVCRFRAGRGWWGRVAFEYGEGVWVGVGGLVAAGFPWWQEASSPGWGLGIDAHASAVYGDVVMPPAQGGEVLRCVVPASRSRDDVMHLETVCGVASVDGASVIAGQHRPPQRWPHAGGGPVVDDVSVLLW